ncbi:MAG TPA: aldo/keto reductase [Saprospiraceae bacterium]|nr:aldo/keto reductase [Saprospiraceae bacterium]MCC6688884.1 aldo/keto reductase [Saprospiraceae bacterium]HMV23736.1 aldo/keto reductase [Saprospiraceae bacterium]HMW74310.1 aldo/keto reductase [Saprospiraceae bacterium]HMX85815.1 aldo/keto reductase [Saprospiraceae bacterium]
MIYNYLGKSGVQVSALSLGSWVTFGNQISDKTAAELMHKAYDHGVNFFDNAEIYANGKSEIVMGNILKASGWDRSSFLVSSKVYFGDGNKKPNQTGLSRKHIREACNAALKRLQAEYLDLYFCHRPDRNVPMEEIVFTMTHLIEQGKILYWGTSEWSAMEIMEAQMIARQNHLIGPVVEQPEYNMFRRDKVESEFSKIYHTVGLGTTIWSPLASGILTGKYLDEFPQNTRMSLETVGRLKEKALTEAKLNIIRQLDILAKETGISLARLSIAWCLKNPNVSTVILGASKIAQLEETLTATAVLPLLTEEIMLRIDEILGNKPK